MATAAILEKFPMAISPGVLELGDRLVDLVYLFLAPTDTCVTKSADRVMFGPLAGVVSRHVLSEGSFSQLIRWQ